jgi:uncharacterized protein YbbC (DUF1343 family)
VTPQPPAASARPHARTRTGLERVLTEPSLRGRLLGRRFGLLVNQASVTADLTHAIHALRAVGLTPERLFGPEHGVWGHAQDMEAVGHGRDPVTGLDTVSLYGHTAESLTPESGVLDGLDVVLIDLPDVGTRYYTFAATAAYLAEAASRAGAEVWVLDRPNPLGGVAVEGNLVEPGYESFVSAFSVPNRHGLTLGELLRYQARFGPSPFEVEVVEVAGWPRAAWHDETGLPWVMPSPNMPALETAALYPGMCLLEATNVSEGRGTTRPFELFGAPWVEAEPLGRALEAMALPGVRFRPAVFQPGFQKWAGCTCFGLQAHVVDRGRLEPYALGLSVLFALRRLYPHDFAWRPDPYEFIAEVPAVDLLCGTSRVREALAAEASREEVLAVALAGAEGWPERAGDIRIYG